MASSGTLHQWTLRPHSPPSAAAHEAVAAAEARRDDADEAVDRVEKAIVAYLTKELGFVRDADHPDYSQSVVAGGRVFLLEHYSDASGLIESELVATG